MATDSSCNFYNRMRQTFCAPTAPATRAASISEIQQKIINISQQRYNPSSATSKASQEQRPQMALGTTFGQQSPHAAAAATGPSVSSVARPWPSPSPISNAAPPPVAVATPQVMHGMPVQPVAMQQRPMQPPPPPQEIQPAASDDLLTAEEMTTLRVVEFDVRVKIYASSVTDPTATGPSSLGPATLLCDDAIVNIFPKHIVFLRSSGAPVVELVTSELYELSEDVQQQTLTFYFRKPIGASALEVHCPNTHARTAIYKLVCSKRNILESGGGGGDGSALS